MHGCLLARYSNISTEWLDRVLFATSHRTLELLHDGYILVGNTDPCMVIYVPGNRIPRDMCVR